MPHREIFLDSTYEAVEALIGAGITGPLDVLTLLRFRDVADYVRTPDLAPEAPISGEAAYEEYEAMIRPVLDRLDSKVLYDGHPTRMLIGPPDEVWDRIAIVRHVSVPTMLGFAEHPEFLSAIGHRQAALADCRVMPIAPIS